MIVFITLVQHQDIHSTARKVGQTNLFTAELHSLTTYNATSMVIWINIGGKFCFSHHRKALEYRKLKFLKVALISVNFLE